MTRRAKPKTKFSAAALLSHMRPDRKWATGQWIARSPSAGVGEDDPLVHRVAAFISVSEESLEAAAAADPELAAAQSLQADAARSATLKTLVIAGMAPLEICELTQIPPAQLELWESLFFDVRSRLGALDWLVRCVIEPEAHAGHRRLAERLRLAAGGGVEIAKLLVREEQGTALARADRIFLQQLRLDLKLREVLKIPVKTPAQVKPFLRAAVELKRLDQEHEMERARLAADERQAQRVHEQEMLRLQNEQRFAAIQAQILGMSDESLFGPVCTVTQEVPSDPHILVFSDAEGAVDPATGDSGSAQDSAVSGRASLAAHVCFAAGATIVLPAAVGPRKQKADPDAPPEAKCA